MMSNPIIMIVDDFEPGDWVVFAPVRESPYWKLIRVSGIVVSIVRDSESAIGIWYTISVLQGEKIVHVSNRIGTKWQIWIWLRRGVDMLASRRIDHECSC
jgi:hypothetical protein